jgi:hypothetical protein
MEGGCRTRFQSEGESRLFYTTREARQQRQGGKKEAPIGLVQMHGTSVKLEKEGSEGAIDLFATNWSVQR